MPMPCSVRADRRFMSHVCRGPFHRQNRRGQGHISHHSNIHSKRKRMRTLLSFLVGMLTATYATTAFVVSKTSSNLPKIRSLSVLGATKKKTNKPKTSFGGASMEPCPCGSSESYSRCCGRIHRDVNAYKSATASQVVRARYSAYAKKQPEFLMASTHPLHKDFDSDLKRWKDQIK